ncbi:hypothetical protein J5N97_028280 [Dioscorea zingiberensis]|uniref:Protein kinase domain-containing protein n=1 Tax=Dioscorea zingiberensis TaxID=325984 RepID=A0A9D5BYQ4_9LILI|nr:hypothetical protein J5N97_028280 [Dioscorea zingiberensis]
MLPADADEISPEPEASPPPSKPKSKKPSHKVSSLARRFCNCFLASSLSIVSPATTLTIGRRPSLLSWPPSPSVVTGILLGDFGLDRWLEHDALGLSTRSISVNNNCQFKMTETSRIGGTIGYLPPENFQKRGMATAKSDVFSFGVVVLEVATGRRRWTSLTPERAWRTMGLD